MKRFLLAASALIALPAMAAAQPYYDHNNQHDRGAQRPAQAQPNRPQARGNDTAPNRSQAPAQRAYAQPNRGYAQPRQGYAQPRQGYVQPRQGYAQPNRSYGQYNGYTQPNRGYAQPNRGYNQNRAYGQYDRSAGQGRYGGRADFGREGWWRGRQGFEGYEGRRDGYWYAPGRGYYQVDPYWANYSWSVGAFVPYGFRNYYVDDPYAYGLPPAPYGCRWIFLGDRLVLIDMRTGLVVQLAGSY